MAEYFKHIHFEYPGLLGLFVLLPLMMLWYARAWGKRQAAFKVSTVEPFRTHSFRSRFRHLLFILRLLAVGGCVLALARPQVRNDEQITTGEGIDIVLTVDVSGSMLSRDFQPNRLEVAKEVAGEFIRSRPIDQIGVVIFSGESYTLSPLTTDKNTLLTQIQSLRSGMLQDGTLIGEGLATAVARLKESRAKSKVVILLTDGKEQPTEDRIVDPYMATEIARSENIKVYTIGMALEGYAAVEETTAAGIIKKGNTNILDEDLLKKISGDTGGQYFRARDRQGLQEIYSDIDKMEKVKVDNISFKRIEERFPLFLLAALFFLFVEILLRLTVFKKFP